MGFIAKKAKVVYVWEGGVKISEKVSTYFVDGP